MGIDWSFGAHNNNFDPSTPTNEGTGHQTYTGQNNTDYQQYESALNDPNSPYNQAQALGSKEQALLNRPGAGISQVMSGGIDAAHANQMAAIAAMQGVQNGPSLAGMQNQQAFGQARGQMAGAMGQNPLAARQAMLGGNQALGGIAQQGGAAVGQEGANWQQQMAGAVNQMGQGDIAQQKALADMQAKQQQLYLQNRQANLGAAQGYEQNYANVQLAQEQADQGAYNRANQQNSANNQQIINDVGAGVGAVGTAVVASDRKLKRPVRLGELR